MRGFKNFVIGLSLVVLVAPISTSMRAEETLARVDDPTDGLRPALVTFGDGTTIQCSKAGLGPEEETWCQRGTIEADPTDDFNSYWYDHAYVSTDRYRIACGFDQADGAVFYQKCEGVLTYSDYEPIAVYAYYGSNTEGRVRADINDFDWWYAWDFDGGSVTCVEYGGTWPSQTRTIRGSLVPIGFEICGDYILYGVWGVGMEYESYDGDAACGFVFEEDHGQYQATVAVHPGCQS